MGISPVIWKLFFETNLGKNQEISGGKDTGTEKNGGGGGTVDGRNPAPPNMYETL